MMQWGINKCQGKQAVCQRKGKCVNKYVAKTDVCIDSNWIRTGGENESAKKDRNGLGKAGDRK